MTTSPTLPNGFTPRALTTWNRYYIPASDTNRYLVGDAVKSAGGSDSAGIVAVTLHLGTGPARGVIVSIDPGLPAIGGLINGQKLSVPATKLTGYYVWVLDDPSAQFAMVDDGFTPANSVAGSVGKYANFTPSAAQAPNGGSTAAITSSTLGSSTGCLQVLSLQPGSAYGANATWLVKFAAHELANGVASGGGGGGATTLSALTDVTSYDLGSNNTSVAAIKSTANAAATSAALAAEAATARAAESTAQATANAAIPTTQKGAANGVAALDGGGKVPAGNVSGLAASATTDTTNAANIGSGTLPLARLPALATTNLTDGAALNTSVTSNATRLAQLGNPAAISTATTLSAAHNGENLICTGTPALTVNTGLSANFGCSIKGAFTTAGSATISDLRATTGTATCCLVATDATGAGLTYDLVGTK